YIGTALAAAFGMGCMVLFVSVLPRPLNMLAGVATGMGFLAFIHLVTHNDYGWVEIKGDRIQARHLYTRGVIERKVGEIECLRTMVHQVRRLETVVIEAVLGRVK